MVDSGDEVDLGGLEGVISWEVDVQEENAARIWAVILIPRKKAGSQAQRALTKRSVVRLA